jgi:hypothetical protein
MDGPPHAFTKSQTHPPTGHPPTIFFFKVQFWVFLGKRGFKHTTTILLQKVYVNVKNLKKIGKTPKVSSPSVFITFLGVYRRGELENTITQMPKQYLALLPSWSLTHHGEF